MTSAAPLIKIMPPGRYTSVEGTIVDFSEAALRDAADAYDGDADPAPLVIGHPRLDDPAYGLVKRLVFQDGLLQAEVDPETIEPSFAEAVRKKRYPKVSGRFYQPDSRGNPKPGKFYLKHVGFLGGAAPSVKGLGVVSFAEVPDPDGDASVITVETTPETPTMSKIPEIKSSDTKTADAKAPDPKAAAGETDTVDFAERETVISRRESDLDAREAAIVAKEAEAQVAARQALHVANVSFAEQQIALGRLAPASKDLVVGVMDELEAVATVSFGEANGELTPVAAFRKLFDGATPVVSFGEAAKPEDCKDEMVSFAAPAGYDVEAKSLATHNRALELQRETPGLSYLDAVKQAG